MKLKLKIIIVFLLLIATFSTVQLVKKHPDQLKAAYQLDEPENGYVPRACFTVKTQAGMLNTNESVIFGTAKNDQELGATFNFDARCTIDKDTSLSDLYFIWDFGDGAEEWAYGKGNYQTEHIYWENGTYTVKLTISDPNQNAHFYKQTVKVVPNEGPHIQLDITPEQGTFNEEFTFDASGTYHNQFQSRYLEYRWDFNGDKEVEKNWSRQNKIKYTYPYGTKFDQDGILEVRDQTGISITRQFIVHIIENTEPELNVFLIPGENGTFETNFIIDAVSSLDNESKLKCRIDTNYHGRNDLTNDIVFDTNFSNSCSWYKKWDEVGLKKIHIEIEDEDGERAEKVLSLKINEYSPYLKYLKSKGALQGFSYKMYKVEDKNGNIKILKTDEYQNEKILKTYSITNDMAPDELITRAETVKMVLTAFKIGATIPYSQNITFTDIKNKDWYYKYLIKAFNEGILTGYYHCENGLCGKTANPNKQITKGEALAIIFRASNLQILENGERKFKDVPENHWAFNYVDTAYTYGLIEPLSENIFGVDRPITRGEVAEMLYNFMKKESL